MKQVRRLKVGKGVQARINSTQTLSQQSPDQQRKSVRNTVNSGPHLGSEHSQECLETLRNKSQMNIMEQKRLLNHLSSASMPMPGSPSGRAHTEQIVNLQTQ